jgi:hypothetical protein
MKLVKITLLNRDGKMVLYALNVDMAKPGILQTERFSIARVAASKQV